MGRRVLGCSSPLSASLRRAIPGASTLDAPTRRAANAETDLSGDCALVSEDFCYFGGNAITLPSGLCDIAPHQQGHRVQLNAPYLAAFEAWIALQPRGIHGDPLLRLFDDAANTASWCGRCRAKEDSEDVEIGNDPPGERSW